jgi:hypothetical protein
MIRKKDEHMQSINELSFEKYMAAIEKAEQQMNDYLWDEDLDGYRKAAEEVDDLRNKFIISRVGRYGTEIIQLTEMIKRFG